MERQRQPTILPRRCRAPVPPRLQPPTFLAPPAPLFSTGASTCRCCLGAAFLPCSRPYTKQGRSQACRPLLRHAPGGPQAPAVLYSAGHDRQAVAPHEPRAGPTTARGKRKKVSKHASSPCRGWGWRPPPPPARQRSQTGSCWGLPPPAQGPPRRPQPCRAQAGACWREPLSSPWRRWALQRGVAVYMRSSVYCVPRWAAGTQQPQQHGMGRRPWQRRTTKAQGSSALPQTRLPAGQQRRAPPLAPPRRPLRLRPRPCPAPGRPCRWRLRRQACAPACVPAWLQPAWPWPPAGPSWQRGRARAPPPPPPPPPPPWALPRPPGPQLAAAAWAARLPAWPLLVPSLPPPPPPPPPAPQPRAAGAGAVRPPGPAAWAPPQGRRSRWTRCGGRGRPAPAGRGW